MNHRIRCAIEQTTLCIPEAAGALVWIAAALSGCALSPVETATGYSKQVANVDRQSAYPTVSRDNIEEVHIVEMIDPRREAAVIYKDAWDKSIRNAGGNSRAHVDYGIQYDLVLAWFRNDSLFSDEKKRLVRNGVQERMLTASTARCNVFKTYLRRDQSTTDFTLGLAATVSGVLGAVLPGATASRNLAGTAGIFSGARAEYDQAHFSNLAANVIVNGIEKRQSEVQTELRKNGQTKDIYTYPMEAAIRDAIYYDGLCATIVGLNYADAAIKTVSNPGLVEASRIATSVQALHLITNAPDLKTLQANGDLAKLQATSRVPRRRWPHRPRRV